MLSKCLNFRFRGCSGIRTRSCLAFTSHYHLSYSSPLTIRAPFQLHTPLLPACSLFRSLGGYSLRHGCILCVTVVFCAPHSRRLFADDQPVMDAAILGHKAPNEQSHSLRHMLPYTVTPSVRHLTDKAQPEVIGRERRARCARAPGSSLGSARAPSRLPSERT